MHETFRIRIAAIGCLGGSLLILWSVLTVMITVVASALTVPLVRRHDMRSRPDVRDVLRAQLDDIDAQIASGTIRPQEAASLRAEIKRRALFEARQPESDARPLSRGVLGWLPIAVASFVAIAATALYAMIGSPRLPSVAAVGNGGADPQATSQGAPQNVPKLAALIGQLEQKMRAHPGDPKGWQMLGWSYMQTGRPGDAATAYARAAALDPKDSEYLSAEGEALTQAAAGEVTPAALNAFHRAMALNPGDSRARYFLAAFKDQQGDHTAAIDDWVALLKAAPADAQWKSEVRQVIQRTARQYNIDLSGKLPAAEGGVSSR